MGHRHQLIVLILIPISFIAIYFISFHDSSHVVRAYVLEKQGYRWLPAEREIYHISGNRVFSINSDHIDYFPDCQVVSPDDWECHCFNEKNCTFGFNDGRLWKNPAPPNIKYVSAWRYHRARCKALVTDPNVGFFWGLYWCVSEWKL
jgi:hypothetical protein